MARFLCGGVLVALLAGASSAAGQAFTVVTLNAFLRPYLISQDGQRERAAQLPAVVLAAAPDADVIVHQEAYVETETLVRGYRQLGWKHFLLPKGKSSQVNSGLLIASRFPIARAASLKFRHSVGIERWVGKGAAYVEVNKDNSSFHVFTAHLQSLNKKKYRRARRAQLLELREFYVAQKLPEDEAVFVAGDFNIPQERGPALFERLFGAQMPDWDPGPTVTVAPSLSGLVGRDGGARVYGCEEEYRRTGVCSCCPSKLLDYGWLLRGHRVPLMFSARIHCGKISETSVCWSAPLRFGHVPPAAPGCRAQRSIEDLSDHCMLIATARF